MAVARAVYGDLVVINFTIDATSNPNSTNTPKLIINLYKQGYRIVGDDYAVYDAANEHAIIDTEAFKEIMIREAEEIVNVWHYAGKDNPPPSSRLSEQGEKDIKQLMKAKVSLISSIRVYGSDYDDMGVM